MLFLSSYIEEEEDLSADLQKIFFKSSEETINKSTILTEQLKSWDISRFGFLV